ncbi:MAG: hypothetical protein MZV70_61325 [Desulfobacterales bacterium]|nr:hypothetical protein [Desulfobacterales bacterium]
MLCRHSLTGRMEMRACAYNYECATCDFDQFFEDVWAAKTVKAPTDIRRVKGFGVPADHYFHDGHTWARVESGGAIRIGMDDFALKLFGRADAFDLPLMGHELNPGRGILGTQAPGPCGGRARAGRRSDHGGQPEGARGAGHGQP